MLKFLSRRAPAPSPLAQQAAERARARQTRRAEEETDWETVRRPRRLEQDQLVAQAEAWLDALPRQVQPRHLAQRYPRIVNMLALSWGDAMLMDTHFDSLLNDKRGGRRGFPAPIPMELARLHRHYRTLPAPWREPRAA